jgi:tetratricopeptide (TPR) repeat protein
MDSSRTEATPTQSHGEASAPPVRLAFDADAKKHFDAFETLFFQQGEEESLAGANDAYYESEPRLKRWLPYHVLLGISIASTTVAVVACIALWRNNAPTATDLTALAPKQVAPTAPVAVAVAPAATAAPTVSAPAPAAEEPAATAPVAAPAPAAEEPAAAVPTAPAPTAPAVAPTPSEPAVAPAAAPVPTPAPAVAVKPAEPAPAPAAAPAAPAVAQAEPAKVEPEKPKAEPAKAEAEKPKAEAPAAQAAAPAGSEARARCRQSIRDRKAKDIVALCAAAFEQDGTDAEAAVAVAKVEFDRGRFTQAYNWSKKAIAVNPATADAYVYAGGAEQNQGHGKAAKEAYLQYLRLAPTGRYAAELRTIVNSL